MGFLRGSALLALLLAATAGAQAPAPAPAPLPPPPPPPLVEAEPPPPPPPPAPPPEPPAKPIFRGGLELLPLSLSSGTPGGEADFFTQLTPMLGFQYGDGFVLEVGAPLRLRIYDGPPAQRVTDFW